MSDPLTNPGPLECLPPHPDTPNSEDLVDLEMDRMRAENAELRRALAAVVPMAREADPTGCAAEVVEAEGALGMSVGQAMDYYRTQVEASARVELTGLRARLEAAKALETSAVRKLYASERGAAALWAALEHASLLLHHRLCNRGTREDCQFAPCQKFRDALASDAGKGFVPRAEMETLLESAMDIAFDERVSEDDARARIRALVRP